ncbi:TPA: UDP-N-acetylglucosamine 2-epimerase (non-hydrolyzing) [Aeromonas veronii]|nr:UDP-N-acetylglucosamine 2-epimerase (non-hydrolyzing) [Aeromonas veronii]HDO1329487.1 UDP-N-acetylglucosamine 2-epimerase (non-hydrolyzing) [Aeromonas veronii]HDO1334150.1 UDP-N-acetylglucosamine 2-epimerase (non-hydrolyzing) [Aeromonas veronii]HDO1337729.1 UDP-N-acetylglucosamine 2-epimerase (non-hydrolyzing) [Aeromonas veronii]HDO1343855.1 UDP-N-acetylglucosamine 2-epimerase (non-hydrolyzing) [Aeromonas veronii]HDO1347327.1 UDP-N-acetylglucosamine 2-epimerase (non-hydrolyzing) [Aeromonas 
MKKIMMVSGTRPEIIKLAPLYHALKQKPWADVCWVHTGQHDSMAVQVLDCFDITPNYALLRHGSSLFDFSQGCRAQLESLMVQVEWDMVIVQGDTESAFLGALTAFYHQVPITHVEAGLRTYRLDRPFPEEGLRQMIGRLAQLHMAPTDRARDSLLAEQVPTERVHVTGNTVIDAQLWASKRHGIKRKGDQPGHLLVTVHRRENWGNEVAGICRAIARLATANPGMRVLFPVHLNPVIKQVVYPLLGHLSNVTLTEPLDYLAMQQAIADAWLVMTDSGGLQEEAPTYGVPLLVLREETERPEAVDSGYAQLMGTDEELIVQRVSELWQAGDFEPREMANPFGDGQACSRIVAIMADTLLR